MKNYNDYLKEQLENKDFRIEWKKTERKYRLKKDKISSLTMDL